MTSLTAVDNRHWLRLSGFTWILWYLVFQVILIFRYYYPIQVNPDNRSQCLLSTAVNDVINHKIALQKISIISDSNDPLIMCTWRDFKMTKQLPMGSLEGENRRTDNKIALQKITLLMSVTRRVSLINQKLMHSEFNLSIFVCVKIWPKALKRAHRVCYQDM
jgi:hypothetical protein